MGNGSLLVLLVVATACRVAFSRRMLRPEHLPKPVMFSALSNSTITLPGESKVRLSVSLGSVSQTNRIDARQEQSAPPAAVDFAVLPSVMERGKVEDMLELLRSYDTYDEDPDTVDGMPTYEIFVDNPDLYEDHPTTKVLDKDPRALPRRIALREKLKEIMEPVLNEKLTPFVRTHFPEACSSKGASRYCRPCYSLIRRYRHGERESHATHHDGHAIVTIVVSLSDYGKDYLGGLYVSTGYGQREFLGLQRGDAVVHQSTLLHGVKVYDLEEHPDQTERWSWILWYRDSEKCDDYSHEWFAGCADAGNPVCQHLHSTKVGNLPDVAHEEVNDRVMELNRKAALGGEGNAAVKIARAYLKQLPSSLPLDVKEAKRHFRMAIACHNADGHYGMAQITLMEAFYTQQREGQNVDAQLREVVKHFEQGAKLGHTFSMFNLGMAHIYGYGVPAINTTLGAAWMVHSALPEGFYIASYQAASVGNSEHQRLYDERARVMGFYQPWRTEARLRTGSGGAGGVDINLQWPKAKDGRIPPQF